MRASGTPQAAPNASPTGWRSAGTPFGRRVCARAAGNGNTLRITPEPDDADTSRATDAPTKACPMSESTEAWSHGGAYEMFMGRWSRRVAEQFVAWLAPGPDLRWLDVGSGTGALSAAITSCARPAGVVALDASTGYIDHARRHVADPRVTFVVGDAHDLSPSDGFDAVVSGLMLNFVAKPAAVVASMRAVATPDGVVAAYVWDYARIDLLRHFWTAARALDHRASTLDESVRFAAWDADHLSTLWRHAGLRDVRTASVTVELHLRDVDDYWLPFLGGQGPAPGYVASVDDRGRAALRDRLRTQLPIAADGSLALPATAWAVAGCR